MNMPALAHHEPHYSTRNNWLRATVLGANDGLISTASLLMGMAAAAQTRETLLIAGLAAMISGAVSMAAGEYVSVSSQSDTERADLAKERYELQHHPERELQELARVYEARGLSPQLAQQVAAELTQHNALEAHARDEIGITETLAANPLQAAWSSAASFCLGAGIPLAVIWLLPFNASIVWLPITTILGLMFLGAVSAKLGGAPLLPAMCRVVIWGMIALVSTAAIGRLFHVSA